ncbi:MAG TPA: DNA repair protein RecN, partial [Rhizomicrobium sp.]|nr:DNA repair protein RecN [Rhizomicrobium sp.]
TGAGKSILLDALGLAAGARAGARSSVRPGAPQGSATAIFDLPAAHRARALANENGIPGDDEIILRRAISADGRTRAFVNDEPVGVALLRDLGGQLVEIHGQSDDRGLYDNANHRRLLDAFDGNEQLAGDVAARFADLAAARTALETLRRATEQAAADADFVRHAVEELSALGPEVGEEEILASERTLLMNASKIGEDVSAAIEFLTGDKAGEASVASALKRLSRMSEEARAAAASAETGLEQAFALIEEARHELESLLSRLEVDTGDLERKEERLFALRALARKYAVTADELPRVLLDFQNKLDGIDGGGGKLKAAEVAVATAHKAFLETAKRLSAARAAAAKKLEAAVMGELVPLKLGHAKFRVALEPVGEVGAATGLEKVAFELATLDGAAFGPLTKIASGGELARFSLALKVALSESSPHAALVFDEVDRGVGGAVADAVGERLQRLSKSTQVLLVTHAPQVAARAARHFRITRKGDITAVTQLSDDERVEELARMLSGAAITEEARAAAKRLLSEAANTPKTGAPKKASRKRA